MSPFRRLILAALLSTLVLPACKNSTVKDDSVSPDLITNPVTASGKNNKGDLPIIEFDQYKHDFGTMIQGEKLSHTFKFTNTGGADLIISQASATCGCTVPTFSSKPVKPGERGSIEVVFNSAGRTGSNHKTISILANTQPNTVQLEITAEILVPKSKK